MEACNEPVYLRLTMGRQHWGVQAAMLRGWAVSVPSAHRTVYLIEDGQKQDREWNTNYLDLQFVIHMSDFYDQLADGR